MSEMGDDFRFTRDRRNALRTKFGVHCPSCGINRPKAHPTILLPGQKCFDGFRDIRPRLTTAQRMAAYAEYGVLTDIEKKEFGESGQAERKNS